MKKTFLILVLFLIGISFFEAKAIDCDQGYDGPFITIIEECDGCYWEVEWCSSCFIPVNQVPLPIIRVNSIVLKNHDPQIHDLCSCISTISTTNGTRPVIPWDAIIIEIIGSGEGCFENIPPIPNCNNNSVLQIKVTNGGCYQYINSLEGIGFYPCEEQPNGNSCYEFYEICLRFINGVFVPEIKLKGPPTQDFNCIESCERICQ